MGVHGLTSFVEGNGQFFTDLKLRDTSLVIDGCSLYFRLYFSSGLNQVNGGDYDAFSTLVRHFFTSLLSCGVRPFVILDGGMDQTDKKFKTLYDRAQSKICEAHSLSRGSRGSVLPLLTREVFKHVLFELGVPLVQCISEADFEIASLAHHLGCPVLTNDSDFYIFDLRGGYLPFAFFEWDNICGKSSERYIPARKFTVNRFCSHFNHMNKQLLPLFAVITGNDYTPPKITEMFFSRVELQRVPRRRGNHSNPRIEGLLHWLSIFSNPVDALEEVLNVLGAKQKGSIRSQLTALVKDYQLPPTSSLAQFFLSSQPGRLDLQKLPPALTSQPEWLLRGFTLGRLPPLILDVLVLQRAIMIAQVENCQLPSSHETSLSIRKAIYGMLLVKKAMCTNAGHGQRGRGGQGGVVRRGLCGQSVSYSNACFVEEYDRHAITLRKTTREIALPNSYTHLDLNTLDKVAVSVRLKILLETLGVMEHVLQPLPPHLHLPLCVTHFWMHSSNPKPSQSVFQSLLLGLVYGELCSRRTLIGDPLYGCPLTASVCQQLDQLRINSSHKRGLNLGVAHSLSQWQSCMWSGLYLNQLLSFPLPEPRCAWLFSGTLLHGVESALNGGCQAEYLLAATPVAGHLYSVLFGAVMGFVVQDQAVQHTAQLPTRNSRRRGKDKRQQGGDGFERGRGNRSTRGTCAASNLTNRFGMLTCEDEQGKD